MATMTSNLQFLSEQFERFEGEMRRGAVKEVLSAGADVYVEAWKQAIVKNHHFVTHDMERAVAKGPVQEYLGGGTIAIYPQGADRRGVSNAVKAYVTSYRNRGNRTGKQGDKFIEKMEKETEQKADVVMQAKLDELVGRYF